MTFKKNLLKKITIDRLASKVLKSIDISPVDGTHKVDKKTMRLLLEMRSCMFRRERDLDLYIMKDNSGKEKILVLDNDLAIYNTSAEDIGLRKSPSVKEMLSVRNIIKILNDADVIISKKEETVKIIQKECIDMLDLSFDESDMDEIEKDAATALEIGNKDGVIESLALFAELLGYISPPKVFKLPDQNVIGALTKKKDGEILFGPFVVYSTFSNTIKLIDEQISSLNKEKINFVNLVVMGKEKASKEGAGVFQYLKESVVKTKQYGICL